MRFKWLFASQITSTLQPSKVSPFKLNKLMRKNCWYLDGKTKRKWFLIHSVGDIKTPNTFIEAVKQCEMELNVDVYWGDVITSLTKLDAKFSESVANLVNGSW